LLIVFLLSSLISPAAGRTSNEISLHMTPVCLAIDSATHRAFVVGTSGGKGSLYVLDTSSGRIWTLQDPKLVSKFAYSYTWALLELRGRYAIAERTGAHDIPNYFAWYIPPARCA
jgi:hypothetical protein